MFAAQGTDKIEPLGRRARSLGLRRSPRLSARRSRRRFGFDLRQRIERGTLDLRIDMRRRQHGRNFVRLPALHIRLPKPSSCVPKKIAGLAAGCGILRKLLDRWPRSGRSVSPGVAASPRRRQGRRVCATAGACGCGAAWDRRRLRDWNRRQYQRLMDVGAIGFDIRNLGRGRAHRGLRQRSLRFRGDLRNRLRHGRLRDLGGLSRGRCGRLHGFRRLRDLLRRPAGALKRCIVRRRRHRFRFLRLADR